jgi:hypothetical protein
MDKLKDIIRKKLAEMNATNIGGASATPGQGYRNVYKTSI